MRVLILGGTGSIGAPIVRELIRSGHDVVALVRSNASALRVAGDGATPLAGDINAPDDWLAALASVDAVIHVAATFRDDEEETDRRLLAHLLPRLKAAPRKVRFVFTGGCWLFGQTGTTATENSPFNPLPAFAWSVSHIRLVLDTADIESIIIHPGMVYEPCGGVFDRFKEDAMKRAAVRVVGSEHVRWPLVHSADLATLYRLALERSPPGESYLGCALEGVPVGRIARAYAKRFGTPRSEPEILSEDEIAAELGEWARGYGLDQLLSGDKARRDLGWNPLHLDPETEIGSIT